MRQQARVVEKREETAPRNGMMGGKLGSLADESAGDAPRNFGGGRSQAMRRGPVCTQRRAKKRMIIEKRAKIDAGGKKNRPRTH